MWRVHTTGPQPRTSRFMTRSLPAVGVGRNASSIGSSRAIAMLLLTLRGVRSRTSATDRGRYPAVRDRCRVSAAPTGRPAPCPRCRASGRHVERGVSLCNRFQAYRTCGIPKRDRGCVIGESVQQAGSKWRILAPEQHPCPKDRCSVLRVKVDATGETS
ncbi:hypothetical protein K491DRAFT_40744 [Lophiostoma macrostomum CBS 122681]|uniref:Uncharacterized protein n=1 Tax=Lophiostoma macrostomum CBS 122681 TaxID=1314788 RepID=A0A6A6TKY6_9PLEO|nr:hypothetical protein K491DRAFT_40744 [Lophiostoma macrostomum CBS 122681]